MVGRRVRITGVVHLADHQEEAVNVARRAGVLPVNHQRCAEDGGDWAVLKTNKNVFIFKSFFFYKNSHLPSSALPSGSPHSP